MAKLYTHMYFKLKFISENIQNEDTSIHAPKRLKEEHYGVNNVFIHLSYSPLYCRFNHYFRYFAGKGYILRKNFGRYRHQRLKINTNIVLNIVLRKYLC